MTEFEKKVIAEAKRLCMASCCASNCVNRRMCCDMWPGPGGCLPIHFAEAIERIKASMADTA
jgi:hypothetical protein